MERTRESCDEGEKMSEEMTVTTEVPHGNKGGNIVKQQVWPNCEKNPTNYLLLCRRGSHWNSRPPQGGTKMSQMDCMENITFP